MEIWCETKISEVISICGVLESIAKTSSVSLDACVKLITCFLELMLYLIYVYEGEMGRRK